jgi:hypothetical protein
MVICRVILRRQTSVTARWATRRRTTVIVVVRTFVDTLRKLSDSGQASFYFAPLPVLLDARANRFARRISELAAKIREVDNDRKLRINDTPAGETAALRKAWTDLDRTIKDTIDDCDRLINDLNQATVYRDKIWAGN